MWYNQTRNDKGGANVMLENFKPLQIVKGTAFMSVSNNGIGFNKNVVIKMNKPEIVRLMINEEQSQFAIQATTDNDDSTINFFNENIDIRNGIRTHNRDLENTLAQLMDWDLESYVYRVDGLYLEKENAMLFDLKTARRFQKRTRAK